MKYFGPTITILCCLVLLIGCGDSEPNQNNSHEEPEVDCPRVELESLDDCTFDERLDYSFPELVDKYCQSSCDRILSLSASGPGDDIRASRDLSELSGVKEIQSFVTIDKMEHLESVDGLDDVSHIGGGFHIHLNPELRNLNGLSSLESVAMGETPQYDMYLYGNRKLETLEGLESLKEVGMALIIDGHANLRSIEALESLAHVRALKITDNPKLPTCQAEALAERLNLSGEKLRISGNGTGSCD